MIKRDEKVENQLKKRLSTKTNLNVSDSYTRQNINLLINSEN